MITETCTVGGGPQDGHGFAGGDEVGHVAAVALHGVGVGEDHVGGHLVAQAVECRQRWASCQGWSKLVRTSMSAGPLEPRAVLKAEVKASAVSTAVAVTP